MAGSGQARRRGIARLLALCAVLFGLFLMHGAPATAAEGCHGAMSAPAGMHEDPAARAMTSQAPATSSAAEPAMADPGVQQAAGSAAMNGTTCVSTPARDETLLTTPGLLAVAVALTALFLAARSLAPGRTRRRGPPPPGGRSLLLQVCIART